MEDAKREHFEVDFYLNHGLSTDLGLVHERYVSHWCVWFGMNSDFLLKVHLLFNKARIDRPQKKPQKQTDSADAFDILQFW